MKKLSAVFAFAAFAALIAPAAHAQATRTWVSGVGDDVNPCSRTAPCKTLAGAISKTAAGGEISVLDPVPLGALTITKAITINGEGPVASILASLTNGVIVNAGANDVIHIRNIQIFGAGNGINGIRFLAGKHLHVENCSIYGFTNHGIDVSLGAATTSRLTVRNTSFLNIGQVAVRVFATSGTPTASLDNVRIQSATIGLDVLGSGNGTISNSVISHVTNQAIVAENAATINAESVTLSNNGTGVSAFSSGSTVRISNCDIFNNTTGINVAPGGTVLSFINNRILGNGTNGAPNATQAQQ